MLAQLLVNIVLHDESSLIKAKIGVGSCLFVTPSDTSDILIALYGDYLFLCHQKNLKLVTQESDLEPIEDLEKKLKINNLSRERVCMLL
jgi:predicted nucleotidyltransferase